MSGGKSGGNLPLFEDFTRTLQRPAKYSEPKFQFLNNSARPFFEKCRTFLNDWFRQFPNGEAKDHLFGQFTSDNDYQHAAALFELYVHTLLIKLGFDVSVEPSVPCSTGRPDFIARHSAGEFYVEATIAGTPDKATLRSEKVLNEVLDAINEIPCPRYFVCVSISGKATRSLPKRELISTLREWIKEPAPASEFKWTKWDGVILDFHLIPRSTNPSWEFSRAIGSVSPGATWKQSFLDLRKSLESKSDKYGKLGRPYIIAVGSVSPYFTNTDAHEALWGQEATRVFLDETGTVVDSVPMRQHGGSFISGKTLRKTSVSAVLVVPNFCVAALPFLKPEIIHHPFAQEALDPSLWQLTQYLPDRDDGRFQLRTGRPPNAFIEFPQDMDVSRIWDQTES